MFSSRLSLFVRWETRNRKRFSEFKRQAKPSTCVIFNFGSAATARDAENVKSVLCISMVTARHVAESRMRNRVYARFPSDIRR
ncbi:hypothetical protein NDU88_007800 [Pleurodeles waltl]|uniref:Uncharacterized protein n=1 Tax=Pleurodeles waltl TaxID=8319 RepID=A0AAV7RS01_PLEWA|nr:hypothetical protein NDU88_007800 [Pleurodeles waltl]